MIASARFNNDLRYRDEADPRQVQLTPDYILDPIREMFGGAIGLDPCTLPDNPTRAERFYAPPRDGAAQPWDAERIFVNPPYGKARERWVRRCIEAAERGSEVVLLIPAHTDTALFHEALETAQFVVFIRGRVKFEVLRPNRRRAAASHPSALIVWGYDDPEHLGHLGTYVVPAWASSLATRRAALAAPSREAGLDGLAAAVAVVRRSIEFTNRRDGMPVTSDDLAAAILHALADGAGFPDTVLVRRDRLVVAELKSAAGRLSSEQEAWLAALAAAGIETHVWRPSDFDQIAAALR